VADDHAPTRDDIRRSLLSDARFSVCAEAANAAEAVVAALREQPDVCLLDIQMPGNGIAAVWEIRARLPSTRIVMLTVSAESADLLAALRAGANGYLLKRMNFERLPDALRGALVDEAPIPRTLVSKMVQEFRTTGPRRRQTEDPLESRLTSREWQVLELLAQDLTTRQIARRLSLSPSAVRSHVAAVVRKLGVESRQDAVDLFRRRPET
jgi:DNA-binding NarL/FixJ family response regulator